MKTFIALLALALGHCCVAAAKLNILFILADDWGRNAGCYRDAARPGDPGPQGGGTVAWLTAHRDAAAVRPLFELHYGKRHGEELYDLRRDPDQMRNVAADPLHAETKRALAERLLKVLRDTGDRRLDDAFDRPPYVVKVPAR